MTEIVGIKFKKSRKVYYFDPCGNTLKAGQFVIVETARGVELGEVAIPNKNIDDKNVVSPLKPIMRVATNEDLQQAEKNKELEKKAFDICFEKIEKHKLDMKLIEAEYTFDQNKILFYFTSDGRVDFRELVKDLAGIFKTRIELRQIGVRDEAKLIGGLGICGRKLCCASYLGNFDPVSIKMAKEQSLSLNPTKISGTCSRLMCCLKYEQEAYEDLLKTTPSNGAIVNTPSGKGTVVDVNLLRGKLKVEFKDDKNGTSSYQTYDVSEVEILKNAEIKVNAEELKMLKNLED